MSDIRISDNDAYLAYTQMKQIHLWCPNRHKENAVLMGHQNLVRSLSFNRSSNKLCSGNF